jgi:coenzyme F420 hydrogenase subunit beta
VDDLQSTVIDGGYCVGCGACAYAEPDCYEMVVSEDGRWQARRKPSAQSDKEEALRQVCPFSQEGPDEDQVAELHYAANAALDPAIGYHRDCFAGSVVEGVFRHEGSSGGLTSWLLYELLAKGKVDGVIHVGSGTTTDERFSYSISTSLPELVGRAKSRYYPVEMSSVLTEINRLEGVYLLVGLPCFIKAVRRLELAGYIVSGKIRYTAALVCGHLKSKRFSSYLLKHMEVDSVKVNELDYRHKFPGRPANEYGVAATTSAETETMPMDQVYGANWSFGFFKYESCDYCDDVIGECADISFGDAWLSEYVSDSSGTNIVVVRTRELSNLLNKASEEGRIRLEKVTASKVYESQEGGYRHRREGLAYRLHLKDAAMLWRPKKRIIASDAGIPDGRKRLYELRMALALTSSQCAVDDESLDTFRSRVSEMVGEYESIEQKEGAGLKTIQRRVLAKLRRLLKRLVPDG